jgi:CRP/FNR family transcriptional regulator
VIKENNFATDLRETFPFLRDCDKEIFSGFLRQATLMHLKKGAFICHEGSECSHLALVLSGTARVYKLGASGREITLYRIGSGESCILTASCIISQLSFPAFALCEEEVEALVIPAASIRQWMDESVAWRKYLFGMVAQRMANIISVIEEVAFRRMDQRIADLLLERSGGAPGLIKTTHQEIASDLGTSREVVSRILKDFEGSGLIRVARGVVELLDADGLSN